MKKTSSKTARKTPASNGFVRQSEEVRRNAHGIPDYRLEQPNFHVREVFDKGEYKYVVEGDLSQPAPPLRDSKYLKPEQSIEIYRWMLLNRKMESVLESLYKQSKVVGGVYFGLGQEGCSCASAYALGKDDWIGPMIRNQGSMLVRGFSPSDIMMQYMAKADGPSKGRDAGSHFGDIHTRNTVAPISHLGDTINVMAGVALGARMQGKNIACLTYIGDGGQSTGPTYEGFNFAAVQKLGVILITENNLWAYSTPTRLQFACDDLADRAIGYGVPGVIVDGTDPHQVYDATYGAVQRAYRGEGASLIEAKLMRMKGHAIHDAAAYVPKAMFDYWRARDPITRMEEYLLDKGLQSEAQLKAIQSDVDQQLESERAKAEASPYPKPESAGEAHVFCDAQELPTKYGAPTFRKPNLDVLIKESGANVHFK
ncbi:MAG TPA: thiamine pyrophosphate-dependent dehydrogenase E1 component subunit alpha [Terriglobales bacterium]|jgi:TPP-dependent pyruvate/acetoin dehydrogenase alpha subunit